MCQACVYAEQHETSVAWLVAEIHHWHGLFGQQPASSDWNRASMRWRIRVYAEGRVTGRHSTATLTEVERRHVEHGPWPATATVIGTFGSWSGAIEAAGFDPLPVGRHRKALAA